MSDAAGLAAPGPAPSDRQRLEALLVANLPVIDRICAALCRRQGVKDDDAEDFQSWVRTKLVEEDYVVLRKFRGESALPTYLTVVISMLLRDYRVERWGRWRPSAAAQRNGALAMRLEAMVYRQGYRLEEAAAVLRASGRTALSDRELAALLAELPVRAPLRLRPAGDAPLAMAPSAERADIHVEEASLSDERRATEEALARALASLPAEDQVILRLRFWEDATVADISRALGVPQKPLYRRIEKALLALRRALEAAGVSRERILERLAGMSA